MNRFLPAILLAGACEREVLEIPDAAQVEIKEMPCAAPKSWPVPGEAMIQVGSVCRPEFVNFLAQIEDNASNEDLLASVQGLSTSSGNIPAQETSPGVFVLHYPSELKVEQRGKKLEPRLTIRRDEEGFIKNLVLANNPAFDFHLTHRLTSEERIPGGWLLEKAKTKIERDTDGWKFVGEEDGRLSLMDENRDGSLDEVRQKNKGLLVFHNRDQDLRIEVGVAPSGEKTITVFKKGVQTEVLSSQKTPSPETLLAYFSNLLPMMGENNLHAQKARGLGAYAGRDEELCEMVRPENLVLVQPGNRGPDYMEQGHPYQNLFTRALTEQVTSTSEFYCHGDVLTARDIVRAIEGNLYLDPDSGALHVTIEDDPDTSSQNEAEFFSHQTSWALHTLALLWNDEELKSAKARELMAQLDKDSQSMREEAFGPQYVAGIITNKDAFRIYKDLYPHNQMALATFAVRAKDTTLIQTRKETLFMDIKEVCTLQEFDDTLVTHLLQVAGILSVTMTADERQRVQPLLALYAEEKRKLVASSERPLDEVFDGLTDVHAMIGLRNFVK